MPQEKEVNEAALRVLDLEQVEKLKSKSAFSVPTDYVVA